MKALSDALDTTLPNGLRVIVAQDHTSPVAEVRLALPFAVTDPALAAPMELLAACLLRGTRRLSRGALIRHAAESGVILQSARDSDSLLLSASTLSAALPTAVALLADSVHNASYPDTELATVAENMVSTARSDNAAVLRRQLLRHRFGPHPLYADPPQATEILAVDSDEVRRLHTRAITPASAVLLILSPHEPNEALELVQHSFGDWQGNDSGLTLPILGDSQGRVGTIEVPAATDAPSLVLTAGPSLSPTAPGHPALRLANLILGGSGSSRLTRHVRERLGLAYRARCTLHEKGANAWSEIEVVTGPGNGDRAAEELTACMTSLAIDGPTASEVDNARRFAAGFARIGMSTRAESASAATGFAFHGLPPDWLSHYFVELDAVEPYEVADAADRFLNPAAHAVAVSDQRTVPALSRFSS